MTINEPAVVAEVAAAFERYEAALIGNDVATLDALFWEGPHTIRYGIGENLYGPAEIAAKRLWIFELCAWQAQHHGIALKLPPEHPFNPLPPLRLAVALGATVEVVQRIFRYIWRDGHLPGEPLAWRVTRAQFELMA